MKIENELEFVQEGESNQDDSDSEVDEIEPRLKYVRMQNDLKGILQNDAASCIAVHPKVWIIASIIFNTNFRLGMTQYSLTNYSFCVSARIGVESICSIIRETTWNLSLCKLILSPLIKYL